MGKDAKRLKIYSTLEGIEGAGEALEMVKGVFNDLDSQVKDYRESNDSLISDFDELKAKFGGLETQLENASVDTVPKTEMEKQLSTMQKSLDEIIKERDEIKTANEQAIQEKKNGELSSFFSKAVIDSFGAKNAEMAVGFSMANGSIGYTEDGAMKYNDKTGDDAIESFKADNAHLVQNKGTGTTGGNGSQDGSKTYVESLREQMMRD